MGYREVFFRDEIFTANKQRVLDVARAMIKRGLDLTWICSGRIGSVDREMMQLMVQSGCHMIRVGVESGSQRDTRQCEEGDQPQDRVNVLWSLRTVMGLKSMLI